MKKLLVSSLLLTTFIPSIAFASWWNPFSWKVFHRVDTKTQTLEKRIAELEQKVAMTATSTATTSPQIKEDEGTSTPAVKKVKEILPADNSAVIEARVRLQIEAKLKAQQNQEALIAKQRTDEQARTEAIKAELERQAAQNAANLVAQQEAAQRAAENAVRVAAEQAKQAKQEKLNAVNQQIAALNAKYVVDFTAAGKSGETVSFAEAEQRKVTNQYNIDYATLMAQYQQILYSN